MIKIVFPIMVDQMGFWILPFLALLIEVTKMSGSPTILCPMVIHSTPVAYWFGRVWWFRDTTASASTTAIAGTGHSWDHYHGYSGSLSHGRVSYNCHSHHVLSIHHGLLYHSHFHSRVVYHDGRGYFLWWVLSFPLQPYWLQVMELIQEVSIHCFSSVLEA